MRAARWLPGRWPAPATLSLVTPHWRARHCPDRRITHPATWLRRGSTAEQCRTGSWTPQRQQLLMLGCPVRTCCITQCAAAAHLARLQADQIKEEGCQDAHVVRVLLVQAQRQGLLGAEPPAALLLLLLLAQPLTELLHSLRHLRRIVVRSARCARLGTGLPRSLLQIVRQRAPERASYRPSRHAAEQPCHAHTACCLCASSSLRAAQQ